MAHVCDGVLHSGLLAVYVAPTGVHHVKRLPAPCTRQPTPLRALPASAPEGWTRQLDDHAASYVYKKKWYCVDAAHVLEVWFPFEPEAVLHGVALRVVEGEVRTHAVVDRPSGTEGSLTLGSVTYVRDHVSVPRELLDAPRASPWTGPRILPAVPSAYARSLCVPQPRVAVEAKRETDPFVLWVTAFAIVARGCAGQTLRLDATWQILRAVARRLGASPGQPSDPRVGWLVFLLKQERPEPTALRLANSTLLSKHSDPAQNTACYSLDHGHVRRFVQRVNELQKAYPLPTATGLMERLALATNADPEGHFLYLPYSRVDAAVIPREEALPYQGPRDIHVPWGEREVRKNVLSVAAVVALLHLYRNPAWLRALECAQLRAGVTPAELRGWGSLLQRLVLPSPALLARCRKELHAAHNAAFNILQTSKEKGSPSTFALAMDLVHALRRKAWSDDFIAKNTRPDFNAPAELAPPDRAWHRCYLQYVPLAFPDAHARCPQCDRDAASAPYEPAAGVELPNDTHVYLVLPEYALWCALGRDDAAMALAGVHNRAAAEAAVLKAQLGARVEGKLRLFNRADERHPSFL